MNKFHDFFFNNKNTFLISKWHHYFEIYERHFKPFLDKNPKILEIGTNEGGGAELLNYYFDNQCQIVTFDINSKGSAVEKYPNIKFLNGDQTDINFLNSIKEKYKTFDIIIDDGSHVSNDQKTTFKSLYYCLSDNGVYLIEDVHTSYWKNFNGGVKKETNFIEFTKKLIDKLNTWHWQEPFTKNDLLFCENTHSIHYYDSIVVFEKQKRLHKPICEWRSPKGIKTNQWDDNANWKSNLKQD